MGVWPCKVCHTTGRAKESKQGRGQAAGVEEEPGRTSHGAGANTRLFSLPLNFQFLLKVNMGSSRKAEGSQKR